MRIHSSFEGGAGYEDTCPSYPARLPEIFGPGIWWTLHTTASTYPDDPDPERQRECVSFVSSLPAMIPCNACSGHFRGELATSDISKACSNGEELSRMWCTVHNAVNARLGKPLMDCNAVREEYLHVPVCKGEARPT